MKKYRASKLELKEVSKSLEREFLDKYHYQGFVGSLFCYGLFDEDELIELMSFGKPRYNKNFDWELLRLCTKADCQVYGGASRLLKHFREENPGSIVSYCNETKFTGNVYEALGFFKSHVTKGYHYEKDGKCYHRSLFTKQRCLRLWPRYKEKNITEWKIMQEQGYLKVPEVQATWILDDPVKYFIYEVVIQGYHYIGQHLYRNVKQKESYTGSGKVLKRFQKKYNEIGDIKILVDDIASKELINNLEIHAIALSRQIYGRLNQGGRNINILAGGSGYKRKVTSTAGISGNRGIKKGTKLNLTEEERAARAERGRTQLQKINSRPKKPVSLETRRKLSEANKGKSHEPWNKNKVFVDGKHHEYCDWAVERVAKINSDGFYTRQQIMELFLGKPYSRSDILNHFKKEYKLGQIQAYSKID